MLILLVVWWLCVLAVGALPKVELGMVRSEFHSAGLRGAEGAGGCLKLVLHPFGQPSLDRCGV